MNIRCTIFGKFSCNYQKQIERLRRPHLQTIRRDGEPNKVGAGAPSRPGAASRKRAEGEDGAGAGGEGARAAGVLSEAAAAGEELGRAELAGV